MRRLLSTKAPSPRVILSGIQPTGVPHLGNYAGALRQWVQLQATEPTDTRLIYSIVDLHAITSPQPPAVLKQRRREVLASLLAIGIDPERATIFYQSSVPAHSELMWILACTASVGYLSRMTQWKQKLNVTGVSGLLDTKATANLKLGLFSYPVLQAADILIHRATHVPVGDDQRQHLEFARECVTNFNTTYGPCLIHPETITPSAHRIMSLTQPTSKMSKSDKSERSRILLSDSPDQIQSKIGSALTDSLPGISYDPVNRPGISNLLDIYSIFDSAGRSPSDIAEEFNQTSPRVFKEAVADAIITGLSGVKDRYLSLINRNDKHLDHIEAEGAKRARESAAATMQIVREAIGLS